MELRRGTGWSIPITVVLTLTLLAGCGDNDGVPVPQSGITPIGEAIARDAHGVALELGSTLTTEGVVTVPAGVFANNKLKIFVQDGADGIMVYAQDASEVPAFAAGDRLSVTGVIRQQDPTSDNNPATGTVLIDITDGAWRRESEGNPLPSPLLVTLAVLKAQGDTYVGSLVRVQNARKVAGTWPKAGDKTTQVTIGDGGTATLPVQLQRNTITPEMATKLNAIGDGLFTLVGIVVQNDQSGSGSYLTGFEIWPRSAADITAGS